MALIEASQLGGIFTTGAPYSRDPLERFVLAVDGSTILIAGGVLKAGVMDSANIGPSAVLGSNVGFDSYDVPHTSASITAANVGDALEEVAQGYLGCLPLSGGALTGPLDMSGNLVTNIGNAVAPGDAVNLAVMQAAIARGTFLLAPVGYASPVSTNGCLQTTWVRANASVYFNGNPSIGDTITIHGVTLLFTNTAGPNKIFIGLTPAATAANAVSEINANITPTIDGIQLNTQFHATQGNGVGNAIHLVCKNEDPPNTPEDGNSKQLTVVSSVLEAVGFRGGLGTVLDGTLVEDLTTQTLYTYDRMVPSAPWVAISGGGGPLVPHAATHQFPLGTDQINVGGLSGVLADPQDAGWLQGNPVGTGAPNIGDLLTWDGTEWAPTAPGTTSAFDRVYNIGLGGVSVNDAVYISGDDQVDRADASNVAKMPAIGFVVSIAGGTCVVRDGGSLDGFVGLVPGTSYYNDPANPGKLLPAAPAVGVINQSCIAVTTTEIRIHIDLDFTVAS